MHTLGRCSSCAEQFVPTPRASRAGLVIRAHAEGILAEALCSVCPHLRHLVSFLMKSEIRTCKDGGYTVTLTHTIAIGR